MAWALLIVTALAALNTGYVPEARSLTIGTITVLRLSAPNMIKLLWCHIT
jgi:hypothetical protein